MSFSDRMSSVCSHICPSICMSVCLSVCKLIYIFIFSRTTEPISTKLGIKHTSLGTGCTVSPIYTRHSWPLSNEGSLACTPTRKRYLHLELQSLKIHDTHTCCREFSSRAVTACFIDFGLSRLEFERTTFRIRGERANRLRNRRDFFFFLFSLRPTIDETNKVYNNYVKGRVY